MENNNKVITIQGKEINYGNFSDEKLIKLYQELSQREVLLYERILKNIEGLNLIEE